MTTESDYIKSATKAPYLDQKTELELVNKWCFHQDEKALKILISAYMRRALVIVNRFRHFDVAYSDLIQEASLGLMIAAYKFNPEKGVRFSTYADWWVRAQLQDYVFRYWSIVRVGSTSAHKSLFFNFRYLRNRLQQDHSSQLSPKKKQEIAQKLNVRNKDVIHMEMRLKIAHLSLNTPLSNHTDENWQDQLPSNSSNPEEETIKNLDDPKLKQDLQKAMESLDDREFYIIKHRYLDESRPTLAILGQKLAISKERVRQLEQRALLKLKTFLKKKKTIQSTLEPA